MRASWILLVVVVIIPLLELATAVRTKSVAGTRAERNSRMSKTQYGNDEGDDEDDDDVDDEDEDDDEQDDDIYPPDFAKLFPNPDGRPVGPDAPGSKPHSYAGNHPAAHQPNRPSHGPASSIGPAGLRGPVQAQHGQQQSGIGHGRYDAPPPNYRRGPPHGTLRRGPPQHYRSEELDNLEDEPSNSLARQLVYPRQRLVVGQHQRRYVTSPLVTRRHYVTPTQFLRYPQLSYYPTYPTQFARQAHYNTYPALQFPRLGRIYNTWESHRALNDAYNPQFIFNPTEMRARRRFRYHPSQRVPLQRIPIYDGVWGNPRDHFVTPFGAHYGI